MSIDPLDVQVFGAVIVLLVVLYFWVRRSQTNQKESRRMKACCRDLILNNRHALAAAGVDIEGLVNLVRMKISSKQLGEVIKLLTRPRKLYNMEEMDDPKYLEENLDVEGGPRMSKEGPERAAAPAVGDPNIAENRIVSDEKASPAATAETEDTTIPESMTPQEEKSWLDLAHKRFRDALTKRGIADRRARLRVLVKMVELGKAAVDEAQGKPFARKEYERKLWDKFYENEYLALNLD